MHPDRRRAGRAIRKERRLWKEKSESEQLAATLAFMSQLPAMFAESFRGIGQGFMAMAGALQRTPERNAPALPPVRESLVPIGAGTYRPSHSGDHALKSAPVAGESMSPKQENRRPR